MVGLQSLDFYVTECLCVSELLTYIQRLFAELEVSYCVVMVSLTSKFIS